VALSKATAKIFSCALGMRKRLLEFLGCARAAPGSSAKPSDLLPGSAVIALATERVEGRLAAILAADVTGYSGLMGADDEGTLASSLVK
jgi:class 3 adenylate cyclase